MKVCTHVAGYSRAGLLRCGWGILHVSRCVVRMQILIYTPGHCFAHWPSSMSGVAVTPALEAEYSLPAARGSSYTTSWCETRRRYGRLEDLWDKYGSLGPYLFVVSLCAEHRPGTTYGRGSPDTSPDTCLSCCVFITDEQGHNMVARSVESGFKSQAVRTP
jgi:hypothetical protein